MQTIESKVKKILIGFVVIVIFGTILINFAFNITLIRQLIILMIDITLILIAGYFYFNPEFLIKRRKEILLLVIFLFLFFIIMETVLRITDCGWKWDVTPGGDIKYKYQTSKKICNSIIDGKRFYRITNNEGFIDDNFKYDKEDYNIFLVGDSYAACLESDYENCAHQKLERDLKEEYGEKINVMNFGVSSYSGLAELEIVKKYTEIYHPKMIILYFYVNDFRENQDYLNEVYVRSNSQKFIRTITPKTFLFFFTNGKNLLDNFLIRFKWYRDLSGLENQARSGRGVYLKEPTPEWDELIKIQLNILDEIYALAEEENITLLQVATTAKEQVYGEKWAQAFKIYPSLNPEDYLYSKPNDIIMDYAEVKGIHHLDLLPLFRANPKRLHWNEGHWNDEGQLFAAEKIEEYIKENKLLE